jgi:putative lipoic acid-binding regulatory protein
MTKTEQPATQAEGLQFPCHYPIKAMGKTGGDFELMVLAIIEERAGKVGAGNVRSQSSNAGSFQSVTVTIEVQSRADLEAIYQDLSACEHILWTL